jgi:hypothetical protein
MNFYSIGLYAVGWSSFVSSMKNCNELMSILLAPLFTMESYLILLLNASYIYRIPDARTCIKSTRREFGSVHSCARIDQIGQ